MNLETDGVALKLCVSEQGQKHISNCSCLKPKGPNVFLHQPSSTSAHRVPSTALNLLMQQKIKFPFVRRVGLQTKKVAAQNEHLQGFLTFRFPAHTNFLTLSCFLQLLSVETAPGGCCVDPRFTRATSACTMSCNGESWRRCIWLCAMIASWPPMSWRVG